ncbi:MAG: hypothetical protein JW742_05745, partial [Candidatus Aminicenantes bacterium]|nr:hypothetical protein [Candidatus Aminicenantes bacterium]
RTPGYTLWLTRDGLVFDRVEETDQGETIRSRSSLVFLGANDDRKVAAADPSDYTVSYFIGRDESDWKTGISTSKAVVYRNVYDGIDLKVYGTERRIEYDWIVAPGADPDRIRFRVVGGDEAALNSGGDLVVGTGLGRIVQRRPVAHQVIEGRSVEVESAFRATGDNTFGFAVGAYDPRRELTIDPLVLVASTYLGGHDIESTVKVALDPKGAIYLTGFTFSGDFPPELGGSPRKDFFVSKLSSDGSSLIYTAFFPVASYPKETPVGIDVDAKGFVYLAGVTGSSGFPLKNAFQTTIRGYYEGFVLKLSRDGRSLVYSSYLGGGNWDLCTSIRADGTGAAYVGGYTMSRDFPRRKAYQTALRGFADGFAAKVAPDGGSLLYSTYLGGSSQERVDAIAVDASGSAVLAGQTGSRDFPVKNAFQRSRGGGYDGFIVVLTPAGNGLVYSSYMGGAAFDTAKSVAVDDGGACYVTGYTNGSFPVKNAFQATRRGIYEAFVLKVEPKGRSLVYSSYLGGAGSDHGWAIAADGSGAAYVVGSTMSRSFPIKSPYQASLLGSQDAFLTIVDPGGTKLLLSTFLGGTYRDDGRSVAIGANGDILVGGLTNSLDFPNAGNAYQDTLSGDYDAFVLKFLQGSAGRRR